MATKNDITGDSIQTKVISNEYRDNWDRIFKKNKDVVESQQEEKVVDKPAESD